MVQLHELGVVQMQANEGLDTGILIEKNRFATTCEARGLPVVQTAAIVRGDEDPDDLALPARSLFLKPLDGEQGEGVVDLALRAHAELEGLPWSVGWDVAVTPDGPLLVEGNSRDFVVDQASELWPETLVIFVSGYPAVPGAGLDRGRRRRP